MQAWKNPEHVAPMLKLSTFILLLTCGLGFTMLEENCWHYDMERGRSCFMRGQFQQAEIAFRAASSNVTLWHLFDTRCAETKQWLGRAQAEQCKLVDAKANLRQSAREYQAHGQAMEQAFSLMQLGLVEEEFLRTTDAAVDFKTCWHLLKAQHAGSRYLNAMRTLTWWHLYHLSMDAVTGEFGARYTDCDFKDPPQFKADELPCATPFDSDALICLSQLQRENLHDDAAAKESLTLAYSCSMKRGKVHPRVADCIVAAQAMECSYVIGDARYESALHIYLNTLGEHSLKTERTLHRVAGQRSLERESVTHKGQHLYEIATLYERAASIAAEFGPFMPDDSLLRGDLEDLAGWYESQDRIDLAAPVYCRLAEMFEREGNIKYMIAVGSLCHSNGLNVQAESLLKRCLELTSARLSTNKQMHTANTTLCADSTETNGAIRESHGSDSTMLTREWHELARLHAEQGKTELAEYEYRKAFDVMLLTPRNQRDYYSADVPDEYIGILVSDGKMYEAKKAIKQCTKDGTLDFGPYTETSLYFWCGNYDAIDKYWLKPERMQSSANWALREHAASLLCRGDRRSAEKILVSLPERYQSSWRPLPVKSGGRYKSLKACTIAARCEDIDVLNNLAIALHSNPDKNNDKHHADAALLLRAAAGLLRPGDYEPSSAESIAVMNNYANIANYTGGSTDQYRQILDALKIAGKDRSPLAAIVLNNKVAKTGFYAEDGGYGEADLLTAQTILQQAGLTESPYYACVLNNLGRYYLVTANNETKQKGQQFFREAAAAWSRSSLKSSSMEQLYPDGLINLPLLPVEWSSCRGKFIGTATELWRIAGDI